MLLLWRFSLFVDCCAWRSICDGEACGIVGWIPNKKMFAKSTILLAMS
ncbi:MAG: hypothetical protein VZQ49_03040 [Methanobrevibacter sp.]|nr:hypothetical protein [Methanobrevibacter sp.]